MSEVVESFLAAKYTIDSKIADQLILKKNYLIQANTITSLTPLSLIVIALKDNV